LLVCAGLLFAECAFAQAVKPTPTPTPHKHHRSKVVSKKSDSDESEATPSPKRKKAIRKSTDDDADKENKPEAAVTPSETPKASPSATSLQHSNSAPNASLNSEELAEFGRQSEAVQKLIESALELTRQNLTYTYGSADPANGGMDCSGFVYYVLRENGFDDVPRDASGQYVWVRKAHLFQVVLSTHKDTFELADLRPGDLLFWTGTYSVLKDPPVTHTMIYLGTEKSTHKGVMVGSTDGRSYNGKARWGVSVFDFKGNAPSAAPDANPQKTTHGVFVGYAHIPGLKE